VAGLHEQLSAFSGTQEKEVPVSLNEHHGPDAFGIPTVLKGAKKVLGSLGSVVSTVNKNFADLLGLVDLDKEGGLGELASVSAKNSVTICQRVILSSTGQDWRILLVHLKTPVPSYNGWKRLLRCVCAPSRFPNAILLMVRSQTSIQANPDHAEGAAVYSRMLRLVPIVQLTVTSEAPSRITEIDGCTPLGTGDPVTACLHRAAVLMPAARELSCKQWQEKITRKQEIRRIIKHSAFASAMVVLIPLPVLDMGTVTVIALRMLHQIASKYAAQSPSQDIHSAQTKLELLMAPGALALLPLQSVKFIPSAGLFLNIGANGLITFGLGVAAAEVFEKLLEHQLLFEEDAHRLFLREFDTLKQHASTVVSGARQFAKAKSRKAVEKSKLFAPSVSRFFSEIFISSPATGSKNTPIEVL